MGLPLKSDDPLHQKNVGTIELSKLERLAVEDKDLLERWKRVRKWITIAPKDIHRGTPMQARMTADEVAIMVNIGHAELTAEGNVRSTVNVFPHAEPFKHRRRLIKHTKAFNQFFGKEVLEKLSLLHGRELLRSVHDGTYVIALDFSAWFDQLPMAEDTRDWFCFPFEGKWYRLTRVPMGMRTAVDVAQTASQLIASFPLPNGVRCDVYVDNIRFLGNSEDDVVAAAAQFITRSRSVGATINEVSDASEDAAAAARRLVARSGDFLGVHFDYMNKTVSLTQKTISKLSAIKEVFTTGAPTHRNFLSLFGLLFFTQQVSPITPAKHYYCLKEYSETARRLQSNPGLLESPYRCSPSRLKDILSWVDSALASPAYVVPKKHVPGESRYVLVTDASRRGWGAVLLDQLTGCVHIQSGRWDASWSGRRVSAWTESEAIACALQSFFPTGPEDTIDVLSDSSTAVGAFSRGYSLKYAVNRAVERVESAFPRLDAAFWHVDGKVNVDADSLSRHGYLISGDIHGVPERIRRLVLGISAP